MILTSTLPHFPRKLITSFLWSSIFCIWKQCELFEQFCGQNVILKNTILWSVITSPALWKARKPKSDWKHDVAWFLLDNFGWFTALDMSTSIKTVVKMLCLQQRQYLMIWHLSMVSCCRSIKTKHEITPWSRLHKFRV